MGEPVFFAGEATPTRIWVAPRARRRGRLRWWLAAAATALVATLTAVALGLRQRATRMIRERALAALSRRLDRPVEVEDIDVRLGKVTLTGLRIGGAAAGAPPLASIDRLVVRYDVMPLFDRVLRVRRIEASGVAVDLPGGRREAAALAARLGRRGRGHAHPSGFRLAVDRAGVVARDVAVRAAAPEIGATLTAHFEAVRPGRGAALVLEGGRASATSGAAGSGLAARLRAIAAANPVAAINGTLVAGRGALRFDLAGHFAAGRAAAWKTSGSIDLDEAGGGRAELHVSGSDIDLERLAPLLARAPVAGGRATGQLDATLSAGAVSVAGAVEVSDLTVSHRRLAARPIPGVHFRASFRALFDRASRRLEVHELRLANRGATLELEGALALPEPGRQPRLAAHLRVPALGCQELLDALPPPLVPALQGFELGGELGAELDVAIDWADLESTVLRGSVGIDGCRVLRAPPKMSAERLAGSFETRVPVPGGWRRFVIGPENPDFVPVTKVSRNLIRSLLTTEDGRFFHHRGFIAKEFRTALIKDLERGRFAYGASSITMQMVKNVMLGRQKTASRKLQELFLAWYVDRRLSKDRILEIYLNAIEFGPGLYGIGPAARTYFNKSPSQLNPVESAFFSSILPAPTRRYRQYCRGHASRWTERKIERILDRMLERDRLEIDAYIEALDTPLVFRGRRRRLCHRKEES